MLLLMGFQDSWSPLLNYISLFHDYIMIIVIMVLSLVVYSMIFICKYYCYSRLIFGNEGLELIWTIIPSIMLGLLSIPSLHTLYLIDELNSSFITIKVIGHQWYWSYEYSDFEGLEFDSYMVYDVEDMNLLRLLKVDNNTVLPIKIETRVITTSSDVIHSWTVPSTGLKVDAIPGRLNQTYLYCNRLGLVYGQCSEICGAFHSFMPICLEIVSEDLFVNWLESLNL